MGRLFRRILVPHDFSDHATDALRVAADLAAPHRGRLIVLHVLAPLYTAPGLPPQAEIAWTPSAKLARSLRERLQALVARTVPRARQRAVECRVELGDPLQVILAAARRADSIVMATLGRTGLGHLLLGSVAEKVVRHSTVPVLTLRAAVARRKASGRSPTRRGAGRRRVGR